MNTRKRLSLLIALCGWLLAAPSVSAVPKYPDNGIDNLSPGIPNYVFDPVVKSRGLKKEVINPGENGYDEYMRELQGSTITCVDQKEAPAEALNQELLTCIGWCPATGNMSTAFSQMSSFALSRSQTLNLVGHPKWYTGSNVAMSLGFNQNRALKEGMITKEQAKEPLNAGARFRLQPLPQQLSYACDRCRIRERSKNDKNNEDAADDNLDQEVCSKMLKSRPWSESGPELAQDLVENADLTAPKPDPDNGQLQLLLQYVPGLYPHLQAWAADKKFSTEGENSEKAQAEALIIPAVGNKKLAPLCNIDASRPALNNGEMSSTWSNIFYGYTSELQRDVLAIQDSVSKAWGYEIIYHTWEGVQDHQNDLVNIALQEAVKFALPDRVIVNQFEVPGCVAARDQVYSLSRNFNLTPDNDRLKNEALPPKDPPPDLTTHELNFGGVKIPIETIETSKTAIIRDKDGTLRFALEPHHIPVINKLQQQGISCKEFNPEASDFMGGLIDNNGDLPKLSDIFNLGSINLENNAFKSIKLPHYYIWLVNPPCARQGSELSFTHPRSLLARFYSLDELPIVGGETDEPNPDGDYLENRDLRQSVIRSTKFTHEEQVQVGTEIVQNADGSTTEKPIYKTASAGYKGNTTNASFRFGELAERAELFLRGHKLQLPTSKEYLPFNTCLYSAFGTVFKGYTTAIGVPLVTTGCDIFKPLAKPIIDAFNSAFFSGSKTLEADLQNRAAAACGADPNQPDQFWSYWAYIYATMHVESGDAFKLTDQQFQMIQDDTWWKTANCGPNNMNNTTDLCRNAYCYDTCQTYNCAHICWSSQGVKTDNCGPTIYTRETTVMGLGQIEESTYEGSVLGNPPPGGVPRSPAGDELMSRCNAQKSMAGMIAKINGLKPATCTNWTKSDILKIAAGYCGSGDFTTPNAPCENYDVTLIAWYNEFMQKHGQPMIPGIKPMQTQ